MGFGLGAAAGAHLVSGGEGPLVKAAVVGAATGAAGALAAIGTDEWRVLLAAPVIQVASAVQIYRGARRKSRVPI